MIIRVRLMLTGFVCLAAILAMQVVYQAEIPIGINMALLGDSGVAIFAFLAIAFVNLFGDESVGP